MFLHVLGIFFTSALICSAAPTSEKEHCGKPGQIEGATLQGVWTAETYSPGSVATFTCLHGNIRDGPIKMACIEGSWLDISRGQCKILGQCSKPQQSHENGELEGQWNDETFPPGKIATYICRQGYSQTNPIKMACVEGEWIHISKGQCVAEIVCYQETVKYGNVKYTKETYRDGETVELTCIEGYQIEHNPEELRKCTLHGWSPPLKCISKRCDKPIVLNGYIDSWATFPLSAGRSVYSVCNSAFLTSTKERYETITCTKNGWDHEPKCFKKCNSPSESSMNAFITHTTSPYIEGEKLRFQCYRDYATLDRQQTGEITCLPDGKFYAEKCHKNSCGKPEEIENGKPRDGRKDYKHAESAAYECFRGYKLSESEAAVCLYGKWVRIPKCIYSSCGPPRKISNGEIRGQEKNTYLTGEKVFYDCVRGFTVGNNENFITCENAAWTEPPECRRIGQSCGAPPVVQNGDVTDLKRLSYLSGSIVKYKCANFYKLEGKETITCTDGEWEKEPICRVPCTIREIDMQENNIRFKHRDDKKLYTEHSDSMTFVCISGYTISDEKRLRIQCLDGVLKFPKCLKEGFCVLQQTEMSRNNIHYNKSNDIDNGQTIEFECVEGTVSENNLKGTCINKQINYPKCSTGQPCLLPKISNALVSPKKEDSYESGSSIDIKCEDTYVLNGHISVKCENGQWDELPQCFKPCTISALSLDKNHIEMKPSQNPPEILEHDTEVNVKCKANFKRPGSLTAWCYDGIMKYPRCFSGSICRINQQSLDDNFLDLDERQENEVFYGEGETVIFKCKAGYSNRTGLTGTCTKSIWAAEYKITYPVCTRPCTIHNDKMIQHNIHLKNNRMHNVAHNKVIEFECVPGYEISERKNLTTNCNEGVVVYPTCHLKEQKMKKKACLPPPKVLFGELMGMTKELYYSGSTIHFKCVSYYKLKGKQYIKCKNGVWERPPTCMEPCTLNYNYIKGNNTIVVNAREKYLKHNQSVQFKCLPTFRPADPKLLKVKCLNGKLNYPKCIKTGPCTLNENTMLKNNITVKSVNKHCGSQKSPNKCGIKPYEENETIEFSCLSGYEISDHEELKVKCHGGVVEYPTCIIIKPDESTVQPAVQTEKY